MKTRYFIYENYYDGNFRDLTTIHKVDMENVILLSWNNWYNKWWKGSGNCHRDETCGREITEEEVFLITL